MSDNGGEYTSSEFKNFCKEAWIKSELTKPFNPEQNGVAERKNRTIIKADKAMLHDQDLPIMLWAKACNTTFYVQNRSPHSILKDKTPKEAFTTVKPEIGHLRIFSCPVYIHVPKEKRTKLEPSKRKGMFVEYNETLKAYCIYNLGQRYVLVSRDVRFEEDLAFRRSYNITVGGEEQKAPKIEKSTVPSSIEEQPSNHEEKLEEFVDPMDPPSDQDTRPRWLRETPKVVEGHTAPRNTHRERRPLQRFGSYWLL
jgi:hypothetical protein